MSVSVSAKHATRTQAEDISEVFETTKNIFNPIKLRYIRIHAHPSGKLEIR